MKNLIKKVFKLFGLELKPISKSKRNIYGQISIYPMLNQYFREILSKKGITRGNYVWSALCAVDLAKNLNLETISFLEFGVAGGNGLVELEEISMELEKMYNIKIDVYGFDTGKGLTKPQDYRDLPNLWNEGYYPMDVDKLKGRLKKSKLILGDVKDTIDGFINSNPAPIAFVSFDMDLYSPTVHAFKIFDGDDKILLPRIHCYFDDIMGYTYSEFNGERLAISEFNESHDMKKISPIYSLENYIYSKPEWAKKIYLAHIFNHKLYNLNDGILTDRPLPLIK